MKIISKKGPFIRDDNSTNKMMNNLFIALLPIILFAFYKNGFLPYKNGDTNVYGLFYPLIFVIVPLLTGFITETLYAFIFLKKRKKDLINYTNSSFSIFPGLFLGLILPINTPLAIVILGSLFATIVGKLVYGGFGKNIFNPALVGWIFVITTYALTITSKGGYLNPTEIDAVTTATPLSNVVSGIGEYSTKVKPYGSLFNFLIGTIPGAVGETSALLCIIGFIYLVFKKVLKWIIPVIYISTVFLLTLIIGLSNGAGIWYPLFQILSGGLMFGAIFMATDPVTSPVTKQGQIIYAFMLGILTVIFRYLTPYAEGVALSILTMNLLVFILDKIGVKAKSDKKYKYIPLVIISALIVTTSIITSLSFGKKEKDFNIISKEANGSKTTYIVTNKGYSSTIKARIVLTDNKVLEYVVLEQNDSFYKSITNNDYLNTLINNQYNLKDLDTVTGATITSSALKNMLVNVINDYTNNLGFTETKPISKPKDFEVISKEENKNSVVYVVTQKSFGGKLKLQITLTNSKITEIEVLEQKDSYFDKIIDVKYIDKLIKNQNDLESVDAVTGATISSNSLKKAITNLMKEIENEE